MKFIRLRSASILNQFLTLLRVHECQLRKFHCWADLLIQISKIMEIRAWNPIQFNSIAIISLMCANQIVLHIIWIFCVFSEFPAVFRTHTLAQVVTWVWISISNNETLTSMWCAHAVCVCIGNCECVLVCAKEFQFNQTRIEANR